MVIIIIRNNYNNEVRLYEYEIGRKREDNKERIR
jgi:hypothetical protein